MHPDGEVHFGEQKRFGVLSRAQVPRRVELPGGVGPADHGRQLCKTEEGRAGERHRFEWFLQGAIGEGLFAGGTADSTAGIPEFQNSVEDHLKIQLKNDDIRQIEGSECPYYAVSGNHQTLEDHLEMAWLIAD